MYTCRRYIKFDTFHPAVDMGLPVTRVISRITLQVGAGHGWLVTRGRVLYRLG